MNAQQRAEWMQFCTSPDSQDELMRAWAEDAAAMKRLASDMASFLDKDDDDDE